MTAARSILDFDYPSLRVRIASMGCNGTVRFTYGELVIVCADSNGTFYGMNPTDLEPLRGGGRLVFADQGF